MKKRNLIIILSLIVFILIGIFSQKAKEKAEKEREIKKRITRLVWRLTSYSTHTLVKWEHSYYTIKIIIVPPK